MRYLNAAAGALVFFCFILCSGCSSDCKPQCEGRTCGDDGCGGVCYPGCPDDKICDPSQGRCVAMEADILFVLDNSLSMAEEQQLLAESFDSFITTLNAGPISDYHIAVVTTGMQSLGCPPCDPPQLPGSCINETGENGRFQDRICSNQGSIEYPDYVCRQDRSCRVISEANKSCFYNAALQEGVALLGTNGCGYDRGLAPMRRSLQDDLINSYNANFLRESAIMVVVIVSDEDDCGEVGDISENVISAMGNMCYYASKGIGPEGETSHPEDPDHKLYALTPVEEYYNFLLDLKDGDESLVKFAAIVGVEDVDDLESTTIEYYWDDSLSRWAVENACDATTNGCSGRYCIAKPGTRYIELAQMFGIGQNGFVDTICATNLTATMERLAEFIGTM